MRAAAGQDVGDVGWDGEELVAVRLHLPSRVTFHNSPSREIQRGNIIVVGTAAGRATAGHAARHRGEDGKRVDPRQHAALFGAMGVLVVFSFAAYLVHQKPRHAEPSTEA